MPEAENLVEGFTPEKLRHLYRSVLLPRMIEEKMLRLLRQGRLSAESGTRSRLTAYDAKSGHVPDSCGDDVCLHSPLCRE